MADVKLAQAKYLLSCLAQFKQLVSSQLDCTPSIIVAGDFNSVPGDQVFFQLVCFRLDFLLFAVLFVWMVFDSYISHMVCSAFYCYSKNSLIMILDSKNHPACVHLRFYGGLFCIWPTFVLGWVWFIHVLD